MYLRQMYTTVGNIDIQDSNRNYFLAFVKITC